MTETVSKTIEGLQPGGNYVIQVRAKNGNNEFSDWSPALNYTASTTSALVQNTIPTHHSTGVYDVWGQQFSFSEVYVSTPTLTPQTSGVPIQYKTGASAANAGAIITSLQFNNGVGNTNLQPYELHLSFIAATQSSSNALFELRIFRTAYSSSSFVYSASSNCTIATDSTGNWGTRISIPIDSTTPGVISASANVALISGSGSWPQFVSSAFSPSIAYCSYASVSGTTIQYFVSASPVHTGGGQTCSMTFYGTPINGPTLIDSQDFNSYISGTRGPGLTLGILDIMNFPGSNYAMFSAIDPRADTYAYYAHLYLTNLGVSSSIQIIGAGNAPIQFWGKPILGTGQTGNYTPVTS
jgi:hypothetical protein